MKFPSYSLPMLTVLILILYRLLSAAHGEKYGVIIPPVQAVPIGKLFYLECLSYYSAIWSLRGVRLRPSLLGPPYDFGDTASRKTAGDYKCVGHYPNGTQFTAFAKVFVAAAQGKEYGVIIPPVQAVPTGKYFFLECLSHDLAIWSLGKAYLKPSLVDSPYYFLDLASRKASGDYKCVGNYPNGTQFTAFAKVFVADFHSDKVKPAYVEVDVGGNVLLECNSICRAPVWVHSNRMLGDSYPYTHSGNSLEIPSVHPKHAGQYTCYVDDFCEKYLSQAELVVFDNSKVYPQFRIIREREQTKIFCNSDTPVTWSFNGGNIPISFKIITTDYGIYFNKVHRSMEGVYICQGTGSFKSHKRIPFSAKSILLVESRRQFRITSPTVFPRVQIAKIGSRVVRFYCDDRKAVVWNFNETTILPRNVATRGKLNRILTIHNAVPENSGAYMCVHGQRISKRNNVGLLKVIRL